MMNGIKPAAIARGGEVVMVHPCGEVLPQRGAVPIACPGLKETGTSSLDRLNDDGRYVLSSIDDGADPKSER